MALFSGWGFDGFVRRRLYEGKPKPRSARYQTL